MHLKQMSVKYIRANKHRNSKRRRQTFDGHNKHQNSHFYIENQRNKKYLDSKIYYIIKTKFIS